MSKIVQKQMGEFTVFHPEDSMGNDVIVMPHECVGAEMIVLCSLFMDYGHALDSFHLLEDEYQELLTITDSDKLEEFINKMYKKRDRS